MRSWVKTDTVINMKVWDGEKMVEDRAEPEEWKTQICDLDDPGYDCIRDHRCMTIPPCPDAKVDLTEVYKRLDAKDKEIARLNDLIKQLREQYAIGG
jgi:hypothetical protein